MASRICTSVIEIMLTQLVPRKRNSAHRRASAFLNVRRTPAHALASEIFLSTAAGQKDGRRKEGRGECETGSIHHSTRDTECHRDVSLTHSPCSQLARSLARSGQVKIRLFCRGGRGKQLCDGDRRRGEGSFGRSVWLIGGTGMRLVKFRKV